MKSTILSEILQGQLKHESGPSNLGSGVLIYELPKLFDTVGKIICTNVIDKVNETAGPAE